MLTILIPKIFHSLCSPSLKRLISNWSKYIIIIKVNHVHESRSSSKRFWAKTFWSYIKVMENMLLSQFLKFKMFCKLLLQQIWNKGKRSESKIFKKLLPLFWVLLFCKKRKWVVFSFVHFTLATVYQYLGCCIYNHNQDNTIMALALSVST